MTSKERFGAWRMFAEMGTILNFKCHRKLLSSHFLHHRNPATLIQQGISGVSDGYIERLGSSVGGCMFFMLLMDRDQPIKAAISEID
jgi:hypothetical protein